MSIVIVDNFDSFTFNLYHYLLPLAKNIEVIRNHKITLNSLKKIDAVIISPGPGMPSDVPILKEIILEYGANKPVLGICLGHQSIAEAFGGELFNLHEVWHGVERETKIVSSDFIFNGLPESFNSGRYHSWAVSDQNFPTCLNITARDVDGTIMALSHKELNIKGIQFHPESILTSFGNKIIQNWVNEI
ncbi:MAG: aminodeoxychorismate/anthranilate synthase component II [Bacteroidia bacterium]|nr:aminodeoxychorismate/anthranilate synthase component II [Bacteroidia bacterium]